MLPKYEPKQFTEQTLTDEVMETALERADWPTVTIKTARDAVYMWMSHSAVWDEEFEAFAKELHSDEDEANTDTLGAIIYLAGKVEEILRGQAIVDYTAQIEKYVKTKKQFKRGDRVRIHEASDSNELRLEKSNIQFALVSAVEEDFDIAGIYDSMEEAQVAMRDKLAAAVSCPVENLDDWLDEEDDAGIDGMTARALDSVTIDGANHDWKIVPLVCEGKCRLATEEEA